MPKNQGVGMTKKHYIAIAQALKDARPIHSANLSADIANGVLDSAARNLSEAMQRDNPLFDRSRFLDACGVQS